MKIYVLRHGRTKCNDEEKYNGKLNEDINETGINQALEAREKIKNLDIDLIICSPLLRTKHTCDLVNSNNIPVIFDKRIEERDCGALTGQKLGDFHYTDFWNYNSNKNVEGLETIQDFFKRIRLFIDDIKEKYNDKNILLVTHGGVAIAIYFYNNQLPKDGMIGEFGIDNCEIKEYKL